MKNRKLLILKSGLILALGTLVLSSFSDLTNPEQETAKTVIVTLNVDTGKINKDNTSTTCNFGQEEGISNEEFTIEVNVGDTVTWVGVSSSSPETDVVDITKIKYVKGKNIFGKDLDTKDTGKQKKISAKVLSSTAVEGTYKYDISFTVTNNGVKRNGTFHIDPRIQSH